MWRASSWTSLRCPLPIYGPGKRATFAEDLDDRFYALETDVNGLLVGSCAVPVDHPGRIRVYTAAVHAAELY